MPSSGRQLTLIILVIYGSHQIAITQEVQQQKQSKIDTHLKVYTQKIQRQDKTIQHQGNSAVGEEVTRETSQPINVHRSHHFSKVYRVLFKFRSSRNVGRFKRNATLNASATPPETNSSSVPQNQDTTEPTQSNSTVPFVWPSHFLVTQPATSRGTSLPITPADPAGPTRDTWIAGVSTVGIFLAAGLLCFCVTTLQTSLDKSRRRRNTLAKAWTARHKSTVHGRYGKKAAQPVQPVVVEKPKEKDSDKSRNKDSIVDRAEKVKKSVRAYDGDPEDGESSLSVLDSELSTSEYDYERGSSLSWIDEVIASKVSIMESTVSSMEERPSKITGILRTSGIDRPSNGSDTEQDPKVKRAPKGTKGSSKVKRSKVEEDVPVLELEAATPRVSNRESKEEISTSKQDRDQLQPSGSFNILYIVDSAKDFFFG